MPNQLNLDGKDNEYIRSMDFSEKPPMSVNHGNSAETHKLENHLLAESFNRFPSDADVEKINRQAQEFND